MVSRLRPRDLVMAFPITLRVPAIACVAMSAVLVPYASAQDSLALCSSLANVKEFEISVKQSYGSAPVSLPFAEAASRFIQGLKYDVAAGQSSPAAAVLKIEVQGAGLSAGYANGVLYGYTGARVEGRISVSVRSVAIASKPFEDVFPTPRSVSHVNREPTQELFDSAYEQCGFLRVMSSLVGECSGADRRRAALINGLSSSQPLVRACAASVLGDAEPILSVVAADLIKATSDASPVVRRAASNALRLSHEETALEALIDRVLKDSDESVRVSAARSLGLLGAPRGVDTLIELLRKLHHHSVDLAMATAEALGSAHDRRATPALIEALDGSMYGLEMAAVRALGQLGDPAAIEPLQKYASKPTTGASDRRTAEDSIKMIRQKEKR